MSTFCSSFSVHGISFNSLQIDLFMFFMRTVIFQLDSQQPFVFVSELCRQFLALLFVVCCVRSLLCVVFKIFYSLTLQFSKTLIQICLYFSPLSFFNAYQSFFNLFIRSFFLYLVCTFIDSAKLRSRSFFLHFNVLLL